MISLASYVRAIVLAPLGSFSIMTPTRRKKRLIIGWRVLTLGSDKRAADARLLGPNRFCFQKITKTRSSNVEGGCRSRYS